MPLAVATTTFGTVTTRLATERLNLPGTENAPRMSATFCDATAEIRLAMLTSMSNLPSSPVSIAEIPLLCSPEAPADWFCELPPKLRLAEFTPRATVSTRLPPLKPIFARLSDGPWSESGPRPMLFDAVPASCVVAETVKIWNASAIGEGDADEPCVDVSVTFTAPATNSVDPAARPVFIVRKYRYVSALSCTGGTTVATPLTIASGLPAALSSRFAAPGPDS